MHYGTLRRDMNQACREPRQIIVHQASPEPEDAQRAERLVSLLSIGMERLLSKQKIDEAESVDFQPEVSLNTCRMTNTIT